MSTMAYSELYIGTEVSFTAPSPQKWVLEEKLTEDFQRVIPREFDDSSGPAFTVFKYLCHSTTDPYKKAFMRIYFQIAITGTEYQRPEVRRQQAAPPRKHPELDVLKDLKQRQCTVVPTLLAYKEGKQADDGIVPDGYITYIVWDMVPWKSLDQDQFWRPESASFREVIRTKFGNTWEELKRCGWRPTLPSVQNIIYDEDTEKMHIAGFRTPALFDPDEKFTDMTFVLWCLAIPPRKTGWEKDTTKWAW
ncbi:unnamed protein product [Penicillium glandicola]